MFEVNNLGSEANLLRYSSTKSNMHGNRRQNQPNRPNRLGEMTRRSDQKRQKIESLKSHHDGLRKK